MHWEVTSFNYRIRAAFDGVHAEEALRQSTKAYLAAQMQHMRHTSTYGRRFAAACACLVIVLLGLGGWWFYETSVSAISVDVNPSLELEINLFVADALDTLLSSAEMRAYLDGDALVSITVIGRTDEESQAMREHISECAYAALPNVACQKRRPEKSRRGRPSCPSENIRPFWNCSRWIRGSRRRKRRVFPCVRSATGSRSCPAKQTERVALTAAAKETATGAGKDSTAVWIR